MNKVKTCAIMQPTYIPWIGYFDMIDKVDLFVFYDDVQLTKRSWQVRNKLRNKSGEYWLTLPIKKTASRDNLLIKDALLNNADDWKSKHLKTIELSYSKTPYFKNLHQLIEPIYNNAEKLCDLNIRIITAICEKLEINTEFLPASSLKEISGKKDFRLTSICKKINAKSYLSPKGSSKYINEINIGGDFILKNIELLYHSYEHPEYNQINKNFISHLGIFDLIFNHGYDQSNQIIKSGRRANLNYKLL